MPEAKTPRYELREPLGSGGMGQVYRAFDTVLRRDVALKLLRADLTAGSSGRARLLREARMAANLTHPNICTLYDVGEMDGRPFLTMEILSGETLRRRLIREPKVPAETAARIGRDVAAALAEAHGRGVIHRDIKPENIMLLPDGRVKVLDFGLAKAVDAAWSEVMPAEGISEATTRAGLLPLRPQTLPLMDETLTTPGQILGTYHYLSPEQADAKPADARSDVFSLGVVLYEMLAGAKPFTGATAQALLAAIRAGKPAPLRKASPKAPSGLVDVVQRCLRKLPEERYAGAAGVREALIQVEKKLLRRTRMLWAAGVALIATLGVVAGTVMWRGDAGNREGNEGGAIGAGVSIPRVRRLTFDGTSSVPYFSPDGRMIAYRTLKSERIWQGMVMSASGGAGRQVSDFPEGFLTFGWNVQGDALLGTRGLMPGLWEVPLLGGAPRLFLERAGGFSITPTGSSVAYVFWNTEYQSHRELRVRDLATGEEQTLMKLENPGQSLWAPGWNATGDTVAFLYGPDRNLGTELYVQEVPDGERRSLPLHGLMPAGPVDWTADGQHILVGAGALKDSSIWMVPVESGRLMQLTTGTDIDGVPDMDPEGKRIVFHRRQHSADVVIAETDTGSLNEIFPTAALASDPFFSSNGTHLLLSHVVNGPSSIVSVPLEGGAPLTLTDEAELSCETPLMLDPERVVFACNETTGSGPNGAARWTSTKSIWSIHPDGGPVERVAGSGDIWGLLAADLAGGQILYIAFVEGRRLLMSLNVVTGVERILWEVKEGNMILSATAVERGGFVALVHTFASDGKPAFLRLTELPAGAGDGRNIGTIEIDAYHAVLSRDERTLAYLAGEHGKMEVWIQDLPRAGPPRRLTHFNGVWHPHTLAFSPDGTFLAIERFKPETSDLYMIEGF